MGRTLKPHSYDLQVVRLDITDGPSELHENKLANFILSMRRERGERGGSFRRALKVNELRQDEEYPDWYQFAPGYPGLLGATFTPDVLYNPDLQKGVMGVGLLIDECLDAHIKTTPR
ncbi:MAG TPA: hypothetical protein VGE34_02995 [Candidatus Saccharimonadales bacterium]